MADWDALEQCEHLYDAIEQLPFGACVIGDATHKATEHIVPVYQGLEMYDLAALWFNHSSSGLTDNANLQTRLSYARTGCGRGSLVTLSRGERSTFGWCQWEVDCVPRDERAMLGGGLVLWILHGRAAQSIFARWQSWLYCSSLWWVAWNCEKRWPNESGLIHIFG